MSIIHFWHALGMSKKVEKFRLVPPSGTNFWSVSRTNGPEPQPRPHEDIQHGLRELAGMSADGNTQVQETPMNTSLGASNTEDVNTTVHQGQQ